MITHLMKHAGSTRGVLDYNEQKCLRGVADVVAVRNIESDDSYTIYRTFKWREANPAISAKTKNLSFHLTVNPGPGDNLSEEQAVAYIDDVMRMMGYGNQPYVVYRHDDIERRHYHVVSITVDERGKVVRDSFSWRRLMKIQADLAEKYGFAVGLLDDNSEEVKPRRISKGMRNLRRQMAVNIEEAMRYFHRGEVEFRAILRVYGMTMSRGNTKGREGKVHGYVSFRAVDGKGKPLCRPIQAKRILGVAFSEFYSANRRSKDKQRNAGWYSAAVTAIKIKYEESRDVVDFKNRLKRSGIGMFFFTAAGKVPKKATDIEEIVFVDTRNRICLSCNDCGLSVSRILEVDARKSKAKRRSEEVAKQALPSARRRKA